MGRQGYGTMILTYGATSTGTTGCLETRFPSIPVITVRPTCGVIRSSTPNNNALVVTAGNAIGDRGFHHLCCSCCSRYACLRSYGNLTSLVRNKGHRRVERCLDGGLTPCGNGIRGIILNYARCPLVGGRVSRILNSIEFFSKTSNMDHHLCSLLNETKVLNYNNKGIRFVSSSDSTTEETRGRGEFCRLLNGMGKRVWYHGWYHGSTTGKRGWVLSGLGRIRGEFRRVGTLLYRPSIISSRRRCAGLVGRVGRLAPIIRGFERCGGTRTRFSRYHTVLSRNITSPSFTRVIGRRFRRDGTDARHVARRLGILLLPHSPGSSGGIVVRVQNNTNNRRDTLFTNILFEVCSVCTRSGNFGARVVNTGRANLNNCGRVDFSIRNSNTCDHFGFRDNIREIRHIPRARDRNEVRASAIAITILPRTRRISFRLGRGSLRVSAFHSDNTNNRRVGGASSTVHVARVPANAIIRYRSRHDRRGGGRGTLGILHSELCSTRGTGRSTRVTNRHGTRMNANSESREVHACGCPRKHISSREVKLALCGLRRVLGNSLSRLVSTLVATSATRGVGTNTRSLWQYHCGELDPLVRE